EHILPSMGCVYPTFLLLIISVLGLLPATILFAICANGDRGQKEKARLTTGRRVEYAGTIDRSAYKPKRHIRILDQRKNRNDITMKPVNTHSSMWRKKVTKRRVNNDSAPQRRLLVNPPLKRDRRQVVDMRRPIKMKIRKESAFEQAGKDDTLRNVDSLPTEKSSIVDASVKASATKLA
uniref:Uncharacterized protein n=2 Tax=Parascaris univalens TaxID=6257 RepID=A0A914ZFP9_PARUN